MAAQTSSGGVFLSALCLALAALVILFVFYLAVKSADGSGRSAGSRYTREPNDPSDITAYPSTRDIQSSGRFTASERKQEYIRRGKSPSGVIDGVYNDAYLEDGSAYSDANRDWDADA